MMALLCLQYPTPQQQALVAAVTFEHMLAFRMRHLAEGVTHYLHVSFAHATELMQEYIKNTEEYQCIQFVRKRPHFCKEFTPLPVGR